MSNKSQLQTNNTDLQSILSTVMGLPTQESCKNGKYVWGKYDGYTPAKSGTAKISAVTRPVAATIMTLNLTGGITYDDFSTDLLTGWTFINKYVISGRSYSYKFLNGTTIRYSTTYNSSTSTQDVAYSYDPTTHQISFSDPTSSDTVALKAFNAGSFTTKSITKSEGYGEHLGFVVDDDNSAYPDGGTQDGYWYEKVVEGVDLPSFFGLTEIAVDKITYSSRKSINDGLALSHSLGKIPVITLLIADLGASGYALSDIVFANGMYSGVLSSNAGYYWHSGNYGTSKGKITAVTSSKVTIKETNCYLAAGVEYTLVTMA